MASRVRWSAPPSKKKFSALMGHAGQKEPEKEVPPKLEVPVMDNYCTHQSAAVARGLKPKNWSSSIFTLPQPGPKKYFLPFLTIRRRYCAARYDAVYEWLAKWNEKPKPFTWSATADVILEQGRPSQRIIEDTTLTTLTVLQLDATIFPFAPALSTCIHIRAGRAK
jgi:hypothetical protein